MGFWARLKSRLAAARSRDVMSEAEWEVAVTAERVTCTSPEGAVESVAWDDLESVAVVTTDQGPYVADVFWVLAGARGGCVVPQGAAGEAALLERLQALPGFDNEALIEAMSSVTNRKFVCWQREAARPPRPPAG